VRLDGAQATNVQAAQLERPVAKRAARLLAQIARLRPADVPAAGALAGRKMCGRTGHERATLATGQALDRARGHRLHRSARTAGRATPDRGSKSLPAIIGNETRRLSAPQDERPPRQTVISNHVERGIRDLGGLEERVRRGPAEAVARL
jgi:hypothetical protein